MEWESVLEAESTRLENPYNLSGVAVVAMPASDEDRGPGRARVYVGGVLTARKYDPETERP